jgi:Sulfotransferase domain
VTRPARRPTFFVIGAQRAGTTRFCHLLNQHPEVVIPTKEPFYFQDPEAIRAKRDWYWALFANADAGSIYGEGSTYYSMCDTYPGTAERIRDYDARSRIIYIVRHPLRRIESAWYQLLYTREISGLKSFRRAILESDVLIEPTLYWRQLSAYRDCFPDEQIHLVIFEDFVRDENGTVNACLKFLGLGPATGGREANGDALNESSAKVQPWFVIDVLKTLPGYNAVKRLLPESVRWSLGRHTLKPIRARAEWDSDLLDYVLARIEPDCTALLSHIGLPSAFWELE